MKHVRLSGRPCRVLSVPAPAGGMDVSSPPHRIRDDRLSGGVNVWYQNGTLTTRPALREWRPMVGFSSCTVTPLTRYSLLHGVRGDTHRLWLLDEHGNTFGTDHELAGVTGITAFPAGEKSESGGDGEALLFLRGEGAGVYGLWRSGTLRRLSPTVPTVLTAARPTVRELREDSGAYFQAFNCLTDEFRCEYTADGEGLYYWLPEGVVPNMAHAFTVTYRGLADNPITHTVTRAEGGVWKETADTPEDVPPDELLLRVSPERGCFWFVYAHGGTAAPLPVTGANNVWVTAARTESGNRDEMLRMAFGTWFGGTAEGTRLFVGGSPATPHRIRWSAVDDPLYFPENNVAAVGSADGAVTAFGKQGGLLVVFKEREVYATQYTMGVTVTPEGLLSGEVTDTEAVSAAFPLSQVHAGVGCDLPKTVCLCGDRLVWTCQNGRVYSLYIGGTYGVRSVREISQPIAASLREQTAEELQRASAACFEGHYLLWTPKHVYVLSGNSAGLTYGNDREPAWYIWQWPSHGEVTSVRGQAFYVAEHSVHRLMDNACDYVLGRELPLYTSIAGKWYDLGSPAEYKRIVAVRAWITGDENTEVSVAVGGRRTERTWRMSGEYIEDVLPCSVSCGSARCRYGDIVLSGYGRFTLDRFEVIYRRMGDITE